MEDQEPEKFHTADVTVAENYLFSKFMLSEKLLKSLNELKYVRPSPIQLKVIPLARSRLDMIIQSKSGTGKTLCFSMCLLETYDEDLKFPQALIIVPTREIAVQITNTLEALGKHMKYFKACELIGGTDMRHDRKRIQTAKIIVGTPGRVLHLIKNAVFNTSNTKAIVLDEADKLLESGQMARDVNSILQIVSEGGRELQVIAATATVTPQFESHIKRYMKNPIGITPKREVPVLLGIKQFAIELKENKDNIEVMRNKVAELEKIFSRVAFKQCLLFTDSQLKTESYGSYLKKLGWKNEVINGSQEQAKRLKVLDKLTKFKCRVLITTDLMARGIDIENVNLVINLDLPYDCFTYLHRIGRAGRFGTLGMAITFLSGEKEKEKFSKLLSDIGNNTSMVYEFPAENIPYNFWDFKNHKQDDALKTIQIAMSDQNGNDLTHENENIQSEKTPTEVTSVETKGEDTGEIVDHNLLLLEIASKLVDKNDEDNAVSYFDALLDDYERCCIKKDPSPEKLKEQNARTGEHREEKQPPSHASALVEDYEKFCNGDKSMPEKESEKIKPSVETNSEDKEFRKVIFKQTPADDDYQESLSTSEDESDYETDEEEEPKHDAHPTTSQTSSRAQCDTNSAYENYNQYVAHHYNGWQNTFYFQLANIQNYVKHTRSNLK